jgi:hypothetical protein
MKMKSSRAISSVRWLKITETPSDPDDGNRDGPWNVCPYFTNERVWQPEKIAIASAGVQASDLKISWK